MASFQMEERSKLRRRWVDQAIALAMQNRWEEAVKVNQSILDLFPNDTDALNRRGRALTELGRYREAREAYQRTVELDPTNTIARKNLSRLATLKVEQAPPSGEKVDPRMFIAETGKTGVVTLFHPAPRDVLAKVAAGDQVSLKIDSRMLKAETLTGEFLGDIDPKLAQRLVDLMRSGNRYVAAVMANEEGNLRIFLRETYQDPSNFGKISFPLRAEGPGIRPYTRETLLKYELEEEEEVETEETDFAAEREEEEAEETIPITDLDDDAIAE
ncbi:MAG TPA: tetratricopeptide repeat protein [Chloroflexota bacterium]|nr:tetratricopeptide repeat protein [Chloroflexota bacterium]